MQFLGDILGNLVWNDVSQQGIQGDGTGNNLTGFKASTLLTLGGAVTSTDSATSIISALGSGIDDVVYNHGGTPTHAVMHYSAIAQIRNTRDSGGWIVDRFPSDAGNIRFNGVELVGSGEFDAWNSGNTYGYVGDFRPSNIFFARQGGLEVEISYADGNDFQNGDATIRVVTDGNYVHTIPLWFNSLARS